MNKHVFVFIFASQVFQAALCATSTIGMHLDTIFKGQSLGTRLEQAEDPRQLLKDLGLGIIQCNFTDPSSPLVLESVLLPGYIIKFLRIIAPDHMKTTSGRGSVPIPTIADRVAHATQINGIIEHDKLCYVRVPHKYLYHVDDVTLLLADKVIPSTRTVADLTEAEIKEILHLVARAQGILDFKSSNMMISEKHIYFIDLERPQTANWVAQLEKSFFKLKTAVHERYRNQIDGWWRDEITRESLQ